MITIKGKIEFVVQGQLDGGKFYDISVHRAEAAATKRLDYILRNCYPKWRGLNYGIRLIRRVESVRIQSEVRVFTTPPSGKEKSRLAECMVPNWLPLKVQAKLKTRPIP